MARPKYDTLIRAMDGCWRELSSGQQRRAPERDVEITGVECVVVDGNFPWNIIKVSTDAGEYGLGEAFPGPVSEYIAYLEQGLLGENPFDVDRLVEHMTQLLSGLGGGVGYSQAAVSGIEIALWDVVGKFTELPVYQLLGGKHRDEVQIYADCHAGDALSAAQDANPEEIYDPSSYAAVAKDVIDEGFDAIKFDLDVDIEDADTAARHLSNNAVAHMIDIVEAVREEIGPDPVLGFDLHWNFSVETATKLVQGLEPYEVNWIEDPVPPESVDAHKKVSASTSTPILAGENLTRVEGFLPFLTQQALDLIAPDIQKCGGLAEFSNIATIADSYAVPVVPHNISSPIGTMASVHACSSVPNAFVLEWHAREVEWWDDLHTSDALIQDGVIQVPEAPGLGIALDSSVIESHLAPGETLFDL